MKDLREMKETMKEKMIMSNSIRWADNTGAFYVERKVLQFPVKYKASQNYSKKNRVVRSLIKGLEAWAEDLKKWDNDE